jgi:hypothetical protein
VIHFSVDAYDQRATLCGRRDPGDMADRADDRIDCPQCIVIRIYWHRAQLEILRSKPQ